MKFCIFTAFAAFGVFIAAGCSSMPKDSADKGPKTLLTWAGDDPAKNEDAEEKMDEPRQEEEDSIVTDRPDFTEASSTVGKGRIQLEAGYTYFADRENGVRSHFHSYPEALLRVGLFADWFELRLGQSFGNAYEGLEGNVLEGSHGATDFYIGTKLGLTEQKKYLPETALIIQATLPTGANEFTANRILPGFNFLYGWDVIDDFLSCGGSFQILKASDDTNHPFMLTNASFTINYRLSEKLGAYTEWFGLFPTGANASDVGPENYFDGGFTYLLTKNFQLDIRAGVGLNEHAQDYFVGSGFAVRY